MNVTFSNTTISHSVVVQVVGRWKLAGNVVHFGWGEVG